MTQAFETFIEQYNLTGREKVDGYSRDAFIGLAPDEKDIVLQKLTSELPWSAEWLFFVDKQKALAIAKEKEQSLRGNPDQDVFRIQQQLVKYSGDLLYQKHMIEDYPKYIDELKPLVVDAVDDTPVSDESIEFFKQVILLEANIDAVASASIHLLQALNVPRNTEEEKITFKRVLGDLRSNDLQFKRRGIAQAEKYRN
jgi:hypothetical protein